MDITNRSIESYVEELNDDGYNLTRDKDQRILYREHRIIAKGMREVLKWLKEKCD